MNALKIGDFRARGFAVGLASHGIGTARAFQVDAVAGAFAGIAMSLNALLTSLLVPLADDAALKINLREQGGASSDLCAAGAANKPPGRVLARLDRRAQSATASARTSSGAQHHQAGDRLHAETRLEALGGDAEARRSHHRREETDGKIGQSAGRGRRRRCGGGDGGHGSLAVPTGMGWSAGFHFSAPASVTLSRSGPEGAATVFDAPALSLWGPGIISIQPLLPADAAFGGSAIDARPGGCNHDRFDHAATRCAGASRARDPPPCARSDRRRRTADRRAAPALAATDDDNVLNEARGAARSGDSGGGQSGRRHHHRRVFRLPMSLLPQGGAGLARAGAGGRQDQDGVQGLAGAGRRFDLCRAAGAGVQVSGQIRRRP